MCWQCQQQGCLVLVAMQLSIAFAGPENQSPRPPTSRRLAARGRGRTENSQKHLHHAPCPTLWFTRMGTPAEAQTKSAAARYDDNVVLVAAVASPASPRSSAGSGNLAYPPPSESEASLM